MNHGSKLLETQEKYGRLIQQHYFEDVLFSFQWWFLLIIFILVWAVWMIVSDKRRLNTILLAGFFPTVMATIMDEIGLLLHLWSYSYHLLPFTVESYSINFSIIPVGYMLLYQYARKWKTFLIILAVLTAFAVIVAEPVFEFLGIYNLHTWKHVYSAPIYFLMAVITKWLVDKLAGKENNT
ncbi:hypothetical protein GCM10009001_06990 [Virgibacillus siamensis]|uniref:Uncharacterized protein n=1 Tax=Virgibacillus siamensis TaxID=480071 RepID=A0ABN1FLM5_9BACI